MKDNNSKIGNRMVAQPEPGVCQTRAELPRGHFMSTPPQSMQITKVFHSALFMSISARLYLCGGWFTKLSTFLSLPQGERDCSVIRKISGMIRTAGSHCYSGVLLASTCKIDQDHSDFTLVWLSTS